LETTGLVLSLYRARYGQKPLLLERDFAPYDIAAALTQDGKALTIGVVNPTKDEIELKLAPAGLTLAATGTRYHIGGTDERAHNAPGKPRAVDIQQTGNVSTATPLRVPALSNAVFVLPLK
jgi:alpha-L-arabinofuranosidase